MRDRRAILIVGALLAALVLSGCARVPEAADESDPPAKAEQVPNSDLSRVRLQGDAAKTLDLQVRPAVVGTVPPSVGKVIVPLSAVIYDPSGGSYAYCKESDGTFLRHAVAVDHIDGATAVLATGLTPGDTVVTQGAAELLGVEYGVGEE